MTIAFNFYFFWYINIIQILLHGLYHKVSLLNDLMTRLFLGQRGGGVGSVHVGEKSVVDDSD